MKKLTVLLATLFIFFSGDAQQILAGIYSGSMYNDSTRMLQKYELALSEYRGKVFGYSYVTFVVNDTFYYGIRRVKGYKNDNNELILTDEELLANNFPESPAKRVKRTATFKLAQEDTITNLVGTWQTNRTRQYYSVGGATKTERTVDSSQSPLVAHLQELKIIAGSPNYQEEAVVKDKPKKETKKPKDIDVARRNDRKESEPVVRKAGKSGNPPDNKEATTGQPAAGKEAVAATDGNKPATNAVNDTKAGQPEKKPNTLPAASGAPDRNAVASVNKPGSGNAGTTSQPEAGKKAGTANTTTPAGNTESRKDRDAVATTEAGKSVGVAGTETTQNTNLSTSGRNAGTTPTAATGVKTQTAVKPETVKTTSEVPGNTVASKPNQPASDPVTNRSSGSTKDVAKATDKKTEGTKPSENATNTAGKPSGVDSKSIAAVKPEGNKDAGTGVTAGANTNKQAEGDKTNPTRTATQMNDKVAGVSNTTNPTTGVDTKVAANPISTGKNATPGSATDGNEKAPAVATAALDNRTSAVIRTLEVENDSITLSFYDNGVVDGDVISVFVNGQNVVASARLNEVALKKTIHLANFAGDSVEVTLVAETLGSIPPNTGLLLVYDGDKRYDVRFSADMKTNASIVFRKGKK